MTHSNAASLARELMNKHGLGHWVFEFDRAKRRAGCCKHAKRTITLSQYFVVNNSEEEITDTILHEIAHALVGPRVGHGPVWRAMCLKVGAKPIRCYDSSQVKMPEGRLIAVCGGCGRKFTRHRRPRSVRYCRACGLEKGRLNFLSCTNSGVTQTN